MNVNDYPDIFEPFDELVEIDICGAPRAVPANNTLLRCFQYLALEAISGGDFCWNGECLNCRVWLLAGERGEKAVLACRTKVEKGMRIGRLSDEVKL